ncbi:hypothetical protein AADU03_005245 [Escherichia coli]
MAQAARAEVKVIVRLRIAGAILLKSAPTGVSGILATAPKRLFLQCDK